MSGRKRRGKGVWIGFVGGAVLLALIAAVLLLTGMFGGSKAPVLGKRELTVGTDILPEDVTEFYYTLSSSTDPPRYQRYRFYREEGRTFFYHEKREGDHWPLREGDITVSGTKELTGEEWAAFFGLLREGTVQKRAESTESGGKGPWLYLYWEGDIGKGFCRVVCEKSWEGTVIFFFSIKLFQCCAARAEWHFINSCLLIEQ